VTMANARRARLSLEARCVRPRDGGPSYGWFGTRRTYRRARDAKVLFFFRILDRVLYEVMRERMRGDLKPTAGRFTPILGRYQVNILVWVSVILNIFITVLLYCTCIFL
jgi:hypothetical protein